jgi:uncharacterized membrane protein
MRRGLATLVIAVAVLSGAPASAQTKSFTLPETRIEIKVRSDGAVAITEHITYLFDGSFSGGYREVPLASGERLTDISVTEGGVRYSPGASAELGSSGAPGTFGVAEMGDRTRIVWHYSAFNEPRTFSVRYAYEGLAVAYDDVVDVALQVWGDEWASALDRLEVTVALPGVAPNEVMVWGHPSDIAGSTSLSPSGGAAALSASGIPAHRSVEMRVVFPRRLLSETSGARVSAGSGLQGILAEEKEIAKDDARDRERKEWARANAAALAAAAFALLFLPALAICSWIWMRHGKEFPAGLVPPYVMEPPGEDPPALIAALLEPGHQRVTGDAFTATLFDLIRRGYIDAQATTTYKKKWAGLREEETSDLSVAATDKDASELEGFERVVLTSVKHAQGDSERFLLSEMKDDIKSHPKYYSEKFTSFRSLVGKAIKKRGWWIADGRIATGIAWVATLAFTALAIFLAVNSYTLGSRFPWGTIAWTYCAFVGGTTLIGLSVFAFLRRGWERRSREAAEAAGRWGAFRSFLGDFEGIPGATPGSITIWEQFLCYGIAFGVADRVLAAAELHAPPELPEKSSVYWITPGGHMGAGSSAFAIGDISGAVASASPPSSGGGGGFSGGGGGFSGGGGGGAW